MLDYYLSDDSYAKLLNEVLAAAKHTSFYKERIAHVGSFSSVAELERLPITTKEDLRHAPLLDLVVDGTLKHLHAYHESFGTSGKPVGTCLNEQDWRNFVNTIKECPVEINSNTRSLIRFPYAISLPAHIFTSAIRESNGGVIPASSRSQIMPHTRVIDLMLQLQATMYCGLPFEVFLLAETARLMGYEPMKDFPHLQHLCTAGELVTPNRKKRMEELWGAKNYSYYGSTETANMAAECDVGVLHTSDQFIIEVLDNDTLEPVGYNTAGGLYVTALNRLMSPLIRYKVGDIVSLSEPSCSCGGPGMIMHHYGRDSEEITLGGETITLSRIQDAFLALPERVVGNFWLIVNTGDKIIFKCESSDKAISTELLEAVKDQLKIPLEIMFVEKNELFDRNILLEKFPVGKPRYYSNNNKIDISTVTLNSLTPK